MEAPLTGGLGQGSQVTQGAREAGVSRSGLGALLGWGVGSVCVTRFVAPRKALPLTLAACYRVAIHGGGGGRLGSATRLPSSRSLSLCYRPLGSLSCTRGGSWLPPTSGRLCRSQP